MIQNRYLTCFIKDFAAFYRVLDECTVRQGIINIMQGRVDPRFFRGTAASSSAVPSHASTPPPAKRGARAAGTGRGKASSSSSSSSGSASPTRLAEPMAQEPRAAATTTPCPEVYSINSALFSSMALGALLLGQPPAYSQQYIAVAESSLCLCGTEMAPVPNERVAVAHLLLAFATNVAGKSEYDLHIQLTRQCYEERVRRGLPTPPPIAEILGYRALIDAFSSPTGKNRVPAPKEDDASTSRGSVKTTAGGVAAAASATAAEAPAPAMAALPTDTEDSTPASGDEVVSAPPVARAGGSSEGDASVRDNEAAAAVAAVGAVGTAKGRENTARKRWGKSAGARVERTPPGLEAARERGRWRKSDPLLMVCDILTLLSKYPWSTKIEGGTRQVKGQLTELRSLLVVEKALGDERRLAKKQKVRIHPPTRGAGFRISHGIAKQTLFSSNEVAW